MIVKYKTLTNQEITLTPEIVRQYLVNGDPTKVTDQEIMMFLALCKYQNLNPFLREAYLIKYSDKYPAAIVTGKEVFLKRAAKHPKYQGHEVGISEDGKIAWGKVYMKGYVVPITCEVKYEEYVGKTGGGEINRSWREKPETMLKKVALVQALREAMPEDFGGMYSPEEISSVDPYDLSDKPIKLSDTVKQTPAGDGPGQPKTPEPLSQGSPAIKKPIAEGGDTSSKHAEHLQHDKIPASAIPPVPYEYKDKPKDKPDESGLSDDEMKEEKESALMITANEYIEIIKGCNTTLDLETCKAKYWNNNSVFWKREDKQNVIEVYSKKMTELKRKIKL